MKRIAFLLVLPCLVASTLLLAGCEHMDDPNPEFQGSYAGGNGAFGESPLSPGYYPAEHLKPAVAPATSPVGN